MIFEMIAGFIVFSLLIGLGIIFTILYFLIKSSKICPQDECNRIEKQSEFCGKCARKLIQSNFTKKLIKRLK